MLDPQGFVAEASAANLFILRDGKLITPWPKACLEGITRSAVLELAAAAGIETQERDITPTEVLNADEVFLTGTGSEVVPVVVVEGQEIGDGRAGPVTRDLAKRYGSSCARRALRSGTDAMAFRVTVIGAGAIGGTVGAYIARSRPSSDFH